MERGEIGLIAQLLNGMKEANRKLEEAVGKKDAELLRVAKNEILRFQSELDKLL